MGSKRPENLVLPEWDTIYDFFEYLPHSGKLVRKRLERKYFKNDQAHSRYNTLYAGQYADSVGYHGYIEARVRSVTYMVHRLIWKWVTGEDPDVSIDHMDGDKGNNRFENLRSCTQLENGKNKRLQRNNTSGFSGVSYHKDVGKYVARVYDEGTRIHLGTYVSAEEAGAVVKAWQGSRGYTERHGT